MAALSAKQQRFVEEYARGASGTEAARIAGYSDKRPDVAAAHLLKKPAVSEALAEIRRASAERTAIDVSWVTEKLVQVVNRCMQAEPVLDRKGNRTGEYMFDSAGANRALHLLGLHVGMFKTDAPVALNDNRIQIQVVQFGSGHPNPAQLAAA